MSLINVQTSDSYTEGCTLRCPGAVRLVLTISGQGVRYQLGRGYPGGQVTWEADERVLLPSMASLERRCDAVRFRSLSTGQPAYVSADALTSSDLPDGDG